MSEVTHARRISDECSVRMAEYYQSEPLLQGLPVPRLRLPEVTIVVPVVIDGYIDGSEHAVKDSAEIVAAMGRAANSVLKEEKVAIEEFPKTFRAAFQPRLAAVMKETFENFEGVSLRARVVQAAQQAFDAILLARKVEVSTQFRRSLQRAFKKTANIAIFESPTLDSAISLRVESNEVKGHAKGESNGKTVTNLRVVLREEELEWHHVENSDGTQTSRLMIQ